ncbi:hypothetical protein AcV7_001157 [Taiwanofungus camphoratus]|nr:hypothetical protein AcV7_001157 [Antrodia cinnamomea]
MSVVQNICRAMERIAPLRLAEKWDNVGLLLEAPHQRQAANRVLLTIDLTSAVCAEALSTPTAFIVSYHPPIFKPLSSLTLSNPIQSSLLRCAAAGISVYTPHTALDSVEGGINDWLSVGINGGPIQQPVEYIGDADKEGEGGAGRVVRFQQPVAMDELVRRIKQYLKLDQIQVAVASARDLRNVQSVAICAGSGGSMLLGVDADVYFTGEMSHHEVLAAVATGHNVVLCGHTNTERGYLPVLADRLKQELYIVTPAGSSAEPQDVIISEQDRHPLQFV